MAYENHRNGSSLQRLLPVARLQHLRTPTGAGHRHVGIDFFFNTLGIKYLIFSKKQPTPTLFFIAFGSFCLLVLKFKRALYSGYWSVLGYKI